MNLQEAQQLLLSILVCYHLQFPSLSFAAGGTKISKPSVLKELNKVDMNDRFITNGWPDDHKDPEGNEAWFHSDFKDVSYLYTFGLFNDMVGRANLK